MTRSDRHFLPFHRSSSCEGFGGHQKNCTRADGGMWCQGLSGKLCKSNHKNGNHKNGRIIICDQMNRPQKWPETKSEWSYSPGYRRRGRIHNRRLRLTGGNWPSIVCGEPARSLDTARAPFNDNMHRAKFMEFSSLSRIHATKFFVKCQ